MTKYVKKSGHSSKSKVYHTDEECFNLQSTHDYREVDEHEIEIKGLRECKACQGEQPSKGVSKDRSYQEALKEAAKQNAN